MRPINATIFLFALASFLALPDSWLIAQPTMGSSPTEFVDQFNNRFKSQRPLLDTQVLDGLKAFGEDGKAFDFEKLKGKHTVIIFGCLT